MSHPAIKLPMLTYVTGTDVDVFWLELEPLIERACDETLTPGDVLAAIGEEKALAWMVLDESGEHVKAACVTEVKEHRGARWLHVLTLGGEDWAAWKDDLMAALERYRQQEGLDFIRAHCRPGMAQWLRELGWKRRHVVMEWRDGR